MDSVNMQVSFARGGDVEEILSGFLGHDCSEEADSERGGAGDFRFSSCFNAEGTDATHTNRAAVVEVGQLVRVEHFKRDWSVLGAHKNLVAFRSDQLHWLGHQSVGFSLGLGSFLSFLGSHNLVVVVLHVDGSEADTRDDQRTVAGVRRGQHNGGLHVQVVHANRMPIWFGVLGLEEVLGLVHHTDLSAFDGFHLQNCSAGVGRRGREGQFDLVVCISEDWAELDKDLEIFGVRDHEATSIIHAPAVFGATEASFRPGVDRDRLWHGFAAGVVRGATVAALKWAPVLCVLLVVAVNGVHTPLLLHVAAPRPLGFRPLVCVPSAGEGTFRGRVSLGSLLLGSNHRRALHVVVRRSDLLGVECAKAGSSFDRAVVVAIVVRVRFRGPEALERVALLAGGRGAAVRVGAFDQMAGRASDVVVRRRDHHRGEGAETAAVLHQALV
mmetsp:Transcript_19004/g.26656  ORF Transcript_19004/g.26656 Transcript_19004/m.26656 type:complete len:441 (+) Transcript_19004:546-1868(+)